MATLSDLKKAIRRGDTGLVRELAEELVNNEVYIGDALELAKNLNRTKDRRGQWQDIVDILQEYFE